MGKSHGEFQMEINLLVFSSMLWNSLVAIIVGLKRKFNSLRFNCISFDIILLQIWAT